MRLAKYLFFYLLLSFFSYGLMGCGGDSRRGDGRGSFENEEDRNQEWRRLKDSDFISSDLDRRYKGGDPSYEDFGGEKCENIPACKRLCDDLKQNRRECYRAPEELVEQLEDGLFNLINISQVDSVDISPSLMAGILDIHFDGVVDLVKNKMNEGDLKSFLAWLALNEPIAEAFLYQDKRNLIVREAFEALGAMQTESKRKKEETGLNTGLIREDESFFYLASVENNSAGFQIAYKILYILFAIRQEIAKWICFAPERKGIKEDDPEVDTPRPLWSAKHRRIPADGG